MHHIKRFTRLGLILFALTLVLTIGGTTLAAGTDLVITGVIDGPLTGGVPKAVELYVVNNIPDLSIYGIGSANNGGGTDGEEFTFPAVAATAGDFIYIASEATGFTTFFGFAPDYTDSAASINGDDAIELFENGAVIDVFGDINVDGTGQPWEHLDGWAYRNDGTGPDGNSFILANWFFSGPNALDGETSNGSAATPFPIGSYTLTGGGDSAPSVVSTTPSNGATSVAIDANIDINFSEDVNVSGTWFDITCDGGNHTATVSGGPQSFTLDPDSDFAEGESCTVTVTAANVTDVDNDDPPDNMAADHVFSFTIFSTVIPDVVINEFLADPAGDLTGDANGDGVRDSGDDEFVEIVNISGGALDVSNWTISDGFSLRHTFPGGSVIPADCAIVVFGGGAPTGTFAGAVVQTASSGAIGLNNGGDTITVNDGSNDQASYTYGSEGGNNQSLTRDPDISGALFVQHSGATGAAGTLFSPGSQISGTNFSGCTLPDIPPIVASTIPADLATGVAADANIEINFSEDVTVSGSWFDITCDSGNHTAMVSGGPQNYTLNPDSDFASLESCSVTVFAANVADQDGTIDQMVSDASWSFDTAIAFGQCSDPATFIHDIQGNGFSSPLVGTEVVIEGVVVGDFQDTFTELGGFFLQEEDADNDGDAATSEGIFVRDNGFGTDVMVGDVVRVQGDVEESFGLTRLANIINLEICGNDNITPTIVTLPIANAGDWEWYEGMLITIPQTLYVTGNFTTGRFGEVDLSTGNRLANPTNVVAPGAPANALQDVNNRSRIQLDDGSNLSNPLPLPPYLGIGNTLRAGDTLPDLTGVLSYGFGSYEVQPTTPVNFTRVNTRDATPPAVSGSLKLASYNVLNYFTTIDTGASICGPGGNLGCRGADTPDEFTRQRDKIISAIATMDADVIGLMEVENNGYGAGSAIQDLVNGLNASAGAGTYAFVDPGVAAIGTDAIAVGIIYKPAKATPVGASAILDSSVDPLFIDTKNRPALAQTFSEVGTGATFTVAVNHLKSKGSNCNSLGDPDTGDGQGNCNITRTNAAIALVNWLATDPTGSGDPDFLIMGDLNAYAMEDPVAAIEGAGYTNLILSELGLSAYSFGFQGQFGYLDHALATASLEAQVSGVTEWHINADEPAGLDYNNFNQPLLYNPDPYRSSDHDPVIVGLDLTIPVTIDIQPYSNVNLIHCGNPYSIVPVAILSTDTFDATTVDRSTVLFEGASEVQFNWLMRLLTRRPWDIDGDGDKDQLFFFRLGDTNLDCNSTEGILTGQTIAGRNIEGADAVVTLPIARPYRELVQNGDFSSGLDHWDATGVVSVNSAVLEPGDGASVAQDLEYVFLPYSRVEVRLQLGNDSAVEQSVVVSLEDAAGSELAQCTYNIPANTPLQSGYTLRVRTQQPWLGANLTIDSQPAGTSGVLVDNVSAKVRWGFSVNQCGSRG